MMKRTTMTMTTVTTNKWFIHREKSYIFFIQFLLFLVLVLLTAHHERLTGLPSAGFFSSLFIPVACSVTDSIVGLRLTEKSAKLQKQINDFDNFYFIDNILVFVRKLDF